MQQPYQGLAGVYDYLLSGIDYEEWAAYLEEIFRFFRIRPRSIVDLACGTGNSTFPWAARGYRTCGVDISRSMLELAREKARTMGLEVHFYRQDLRSLQLPFQADAAVLYQDGLNYLLDERELERAFASVFDLLRPGGYFIFNLNEVDKLPAGNAPQVSWLEDERMTLIWESELETGRRIWRIKLTAFVKNEQGLYGRFQEEHRERSYSREEILPVLTRAGLQLEACYRAFTFSEPAGGDRNIFYVVRRPAG